MRRLRNRGVPFGYWDAVIVDAAPPTSTFLEELLSRYESGLVKRLVLATNSEALAAHVRGRGVQVELVSFGPFADAMGFASPDVQIVEVRYRWTDQEQQARRAVLDSFSKTLLHSMVDR